MTVIQKCLQLPLTKLSLNSLVGVCVCKRKIFYLFAFSKNSIYEYNILPSKITVYVKFFAMQK